MKDQLLDTDIVGEILELVGVALEALGALVIVFDIVLATFRYLTRQYKKPGQKPYFRYKIVSQWLELLWSDRTIADDPATALSPNILTASRLGRWPFRRLRVQALLSWA